MKSASPSETSPSLLGRLKRDPTDQAAWTEFVQRYGPKVYSWCRRWKLQQADAQDVVQTILQKLAVKLRSFAYDPSLSFRGWLRTITEHAVSDFLAERRRPGLGSGDSEILDLLDKIEARGDLLERLKEEFDQEILHEALARVQTRVPSQRWEAFRLTALEGLSGAEAAQRLGMKVATVFTAKSKVQKLVQEEIRSLEKAS